MSTPKTRKSIASPVFILGFLLIWQIGAQITKIPSWLLPTPAEVINTLWEVLPLLFYHAQTTILAALAGLLIAILLAAILAAMMEFSAWIKQGLYPLVVLSQTIPIITIAPLLTIWFGFGLLPKVIVVSIVCFFPIAVSIIEGMMAADPDMVNLFQVMGSSRWQIIKLVRFPAALPAFFSGLKIAGAYAVMGAVIGEWMGASRGLGVFMTRASHAFQMDKVLSCMVVISLISLFIFLLIEFSARLSMPWYYKERGDV